MYHSYLFDNRDLTLLQCYSREAREVEVGGVLPVRYRASVAITSWTVTCYSHVVLSLKRSRTSSGFLAKKENRTLGCSTITIVCMFIYSLLSLWSVCLWSVSAPRSGTERTVAMATRVVVREGCCVAGEGPGTVCWRNIAHLLKVAPERDIALYWWLE